jgi:hypothetical protein
LANHQAEYDVDSPNQNSHKANVMNSLAGFKKAHKDLNDVFAKNNRYGFRKRN